MSSTADQSSKNISGISHCKLSIGFSLSWESMHFRHLASEDYDLFDPLNHVWEGVFFFFLKRKRNVALRIGFQGNTHAVIPAYVTGARDGVPPRVTGRGRRRRRWGISILILFPQHKHVPLSFHSPVIYLFCVLQAAVTLLRKTLPNQRQLCNNASFIGHSTDDNYVAFVEITMHYLWIINAFFPSKNSPRAHHGCMLISNRCNTMIHCASQVWEAIRFN